METMRTEGEAGPGATGPGSPCESVVTPLTLKLPWIEYASSLIRPKPPVSVLPHALVTQSSAIAGARGAMPPTACRPCKGADVHDTSLAAAGTTARCSIRRRTKAGAAHAAVEPSWSAATGNAADRCGTCEVDDAGDIHVSGREDRNRGVSAVAIERDR